jgi:protein TonB
MTFSVALGLHLCVLSGILVQNYFDVPPITEPPIHVTFTNFTPPPAPPAPAAPAPKPATPEAPKPVAAEAPAPMPTEMVQPVETPEEISVAPMPEPEATGASGGVEGGVEGGVPGGAPTDLPILPAGPLRVGGDVSAPVAISQVPPAYPMMARSARVEGEVKLEAVIRRDGTVGDIKVVQGLRMGCTEAAIEALKRWRFRPGERNGVPVDVYYVLTVGFRLN